MNGGPLNGYRVVDVTVDRGELCARLLGDLGAEVVKVEPPGGSPARQLAPRHKGVSLFWGLRNAGKLGVVADGDRLEQLLACSDVLVVSDDLEAARYTERHPHLVVTSITAYGLTGAWRDRIATDGVLAATSTIAYKAGVPEREPLFPPASFVDDCTSVAFAFATLAALWQGGGQLVDCSVNEAMANQGDWAMPGAVMRVLAGETFQELRAGTGAVWPSLRCKDGFVRVVILAPRQWHAMRAWLGEPEYLQDPSLDTFPGRLAIQAAVINPLIEELFADKTMDEISAEAQRRGIVCTPLARVPDMLANEHFKARRTFVELDLGDGVRGPIPSGFMEVDGERMGPRVGPPKVGEHTEQVFASLGSPRTGGPADVRLPLDDLRVADFGHGGVGVEAGRMFAEYGADVLKIESRAYPDFIRVITGGEMSPSFSSSSRSKRGFGVNAKKDEGRSIIHRLIEHCDVVIENNSTGTMDELGIGFADLSKINRGIVMASSQLMGSHGPWRDFRGYGPSTRAAGGIEMLWSYADADVPAGSSSIFPDHLAGRVCALGALAGLLQRRNGDGTGCHVEVAQVEVTVGIVAELVTKEALEPGTVGPTGNRRDRGVPWGLFPCAGDEQWVAITVRDDADWKALIDVMGSPAWATDAALAAADGRFARVDEVEAGIRAWTQTLTREQVAETCQAAGVPAGEMLTALESISNEQFLSRHHRVEVDQPGNVVDHIVLDGPGFFGSRMLDPIIKGAPMVGEHTREVARHVLGLPDGEIERLIDELVLEVTPPVG